MHAQVIENERNPVMSLNYKPEPPVEQAASEDMPEPVGISMYVRVCMVVCMYAPVEQAASEEVPEPASISMYGRVRMHMHVCMSERVCMHMYVCLYVWVC
jgi:hypothetical protein